MKPIYFEGCNRILGRPVNMEENQCDAIHGMVTEIDQGPNEGLKHVIVAWLPSPEELEQLIIGKPVYVSFLGGVVPHYLSTDLEVLKCL